MARHLTLVRLAATVLALLVVVAACGSSEPEPPAEPAATADPELEPDPEPTEEPPGDDQPDSAQEAALCDNLGAALAHWDALGTELYTPSGDLAEIVGAFVEEMPDLHRAVQAGAPDEVAEDAQVVAAAATGLVEVVSGADVTDEEGLADVVLHYMQGLDPADEAAFDRLAAYAQTSCGDGDPDAPPDPCTFVDAQLAADAAGLDIVLATGTPGSTFTAPGLASAACDFPGQLAGGGSATLTIETMRLSDVDSARSMYADNAEQVIEDVDLGSLPASTLLTESSGLRAIYVFDAPSPFGLSVHPAVIEPDGLVAAAEAVLAERG